MDALFTKARLSQVEVDSGKTEPVAIEAAIVAAKANPSIEFKNKKQQNLYARTSIDSRCRQSSSS